MDMSYYKALEPIFGSWRITRLIGEGSFGKVFEIERTDFGRTYKAGLKVITIPQNESEVKSTLADGMDIQSATTYYKEFVEEVVDEFALMAQLKGNSNIVSYEDHSVIEHKDGIGWDILIRMELLTPLLDHTAEKNMSQNDILKLGIDICKALEYCKTFNIIHRDIKPENIFIAPSGDYKLGDFGIARTVEKSTSGMSKKGTYTYMAPEVYKGEAYGANVDIYSLGIVLYRLCNNNRAPFLPAYPAPISYSDKETSITRRISGEQIPAPAVGDERLKQIILKACAYSPKDRYNTPEEMRRDLESLLSGNSSASFSVNPDMEDMTERTVLEPAKDSVSKPESVQTEQVRPEYTRDEDSTVSMFDETKGRESTEKEITVAPPPREEVRSEPKEAEKKKDTKMPILIGGGVAVALAAVGMMFMGGGNAAPTAPMAPVASQESVAESKPETVPEETQQNTETAADEASTAPDASLAYCNEMVYGEFERQTADGTGEKDPAMFKYNELYGTSVCIFPERFSADSTSLEYSDNYVSFTERKLVPTTKENQAYLFADMIIGRYGEERDLTSYEAELQEFYEQKIAGKMDSIELYYLDGRGEWQGSFSYYKISGEELAIYNPMFDETANPKIEMIREVYDISWDGYILQLSRDGMTAQYAPGGFGSRDAGEIKAIQGYASSADDVYQGISYMELSSDLMADQEVNFKDGTTAVSPNVEFSGKNTVTVSWEKRVPMAGESKDAAQGAATVEEPGLVTFQYIPNSDIGFVLLDGGNVYKYQMSYEQYLGSLIHSGSDGEISVSDDEKKEILAMWGQIQKRLTDAFDAQGLSVEIKDNVISMDSDVLFGVDESKLSDKGKKYLDAFVDGLSSIFAGNSKYAGYISSISVVGHTDSDGDDDYNQKLSEQRAQAVADYCKERDMILILLLRPKGVGSSEPIYDENGKEDKEASRRVEFIIEY